MKITVEITMIIPVSRLQKNTCPESIFDLNNDTNQNIGLIGKQYKLMANNATPIVSKIVSSPKAHESGARIYPMCAKTPPTIDMRMNVLQSFS